MGAAEFVLLREGDGDKPHRVDVMVSRQLSESAPGLSRDMNTIGRELFLDALENSVNVDQQPEAKRADAEGSNVGVFGATGAAKVSRVEVGDLMDVRMEHCTRWEAATILSLSRDEETAAHTRKWASTTDRGGMSGFPPAVVAWRSQEGIARLLHSYSVEIRRCLG